MPKGIEYYRTRKASALFETIRERWERIDRRGESLADALASFRDVAWEAARREAGVRPPSTKQDRSKGVSEDTRARVIAMARAYDQGAEDPFAEVTT